MRDDAQIIERLIAVGVSWPLTCAACGNTTWTLLVEHMVVSKRYHPAEIEDLDAHPELEVICKRCGFMLRFDAMRLGVV